MEPNPSLTSSIDNQQYIPRVVDPLIERYLKIFGAVEILGTKWCGKTWSSIHHSKSVSYVDENLALANADPRTMLLGERPHVIDEWQLAPGIWDMVRHEVDRARNTRGAFILTGSATAAAAATLPTTNSAAKPNHSGAGRIGRITMRTFSFAESGVSNSAVSLSGLFNGEFAPARATNNSTQSLVENTCKGGWPEAIDLNCADSLLVARDYLRLSLEQSFPAVGLDSDIARRISRSIARNLGQATTYKTIIGDMFGAEESQEKMISADAVRIYLDTFANMFLVENIPGWAPPARDKKRFATKPKRYFADPSIAVAALGMSADALLKDWQTFGLIFENQVMHDLAVYASMLDTYDSNPVRYYRDDSGLECDAIIQLADERWAAIEIKASEDKVPKAAQALLRLKKKVAENPKAQAPAPSFMAVIVGVGEYAYMREDGVYVIPARTLGV
jgi:hypothetical protein